MQISLSTEARTEAKDAADWYLKQSAFTAAEQLADEMDHVFALLRQFPKLGAPGPQQTRILPLSSFPYSIVYRVQPDFVRIIAIAHHSRRPGYWAGRR